MISLAYLIHIQFYLLSLLKNHLYQTLGTHAYHLERKPGHKVKLQRYTRLSGIHHKETCYADGSEHRTILSAIKTRNTARKILSS